MLTAKSTCRFFNWFWYITLLWSLKGVLLMVFIKLGTGVERQEMVVKLVCVFTFLSWLGSMLCHALICMPASKSWQIKPYAGGELAGRFLPTYPYRLTAE
jgi:hypothetical protein